MLLVGAFTVRASGHCYVSRNNSFLEKLSSGKYKNAVSWNSRLSFCISKLDLFEAWVLFRFCLFTEHSLSLPDSYRKIDGPLLAGYKLIYNNFFKDRSFQWHLVLDILTNPVRVTLTKKVTFGGKIHCQFHCLHTTLWRLNLPLS